MRKLVCLAVAVMGVAVVFGEATSARRPMRRREGRPSGGLVERKEAIPSKPVAVVDSQRMVTKAKVAAIVQKARVASNLPYTLDAKAAPATIELVDHEGSDALTLFPESFKAVVNVRALAADGAAVPLFEERIGKELVRAGLFLMGSGYAMYNCFAMPVTNLSELDALTARAPTPETMLHLRGMRKTGIREVRFATYRQACREGWAPAPTNDVQKAIWDEIHQLPTEPIKIKPETKKVTE